MTYDRKDRFYRKAKSEGLRSRAAFKLEDLAGPLLAPGARVVDLGCWPGGWLQVAAARIGPAGRVVGVDVVAPPDLGAANVRTLEADAQDPSTTARIRQELGGPADLLLSDMAPKLTGIRDRDEARSSDLVRTALAAARELLRPGGALVVKIFMNGEYRALVDEIRTSFAEVATRRSEATRKGSAELYVVAKGFRAS